ncbi:FtsW/RodA/SpoVE family cell cycle protein [Clostridium sp. D33t1_170424_F3]|uniref:FtsW/RodA/SpoVE family cell cycle protein n=1 Tax=Clostridium sp. D33t1_170424_F3 TaxID=2787099 RepID=UPI0018AC1CBC|nr:FtsW/RodA/SpoVE family cell cycle protein [Clostridium sp. D33t1_170424_F3]
MERMGKSFIDYFKRADKLLWLIMLAISAYSLLLLRTVPSPAGKRSWFATHLLAMLIGYIGAWFITLIDYRDISNLWYLIAGFCIFLIIYTHFFGIAVENSGGISAKAWIKIPALGTFQPSELIKIGFIITFSKHLSVLKERGLLERLPHVVLLALHALIPVAVVFQLQGDAGSAAIFFCMFLAMSFGAGVQLRYFVALFAAMVAAFPLVWEHVLDDYQRDRFTIFLHPETDPTGKGLQQLQGKISIGSGQLWGRGLFSPDSRVQKGSVPVQQSDYIFSVAGEQLGFIGCALIIVLLFLLLLRTIHVARHATEPLGSCICFGFFGMIASQMAFNLGMCLNLFPVMGVTLPFFSAGGSSAACLYFGFGLVQCVAMHKINMDIVKIHS